MTTENIYAAESSDELASLNIRIPTELKDKFNTICVGRGVSMSLVLRRLIEREVKVFEEQSIPAPLTK